MGTVYLGVDTQTGQQVAIKQLLGSVVRDRPETLERFAREAEALRLLNHPNIVKVLATINNDPDHYIVINSGFTYREYDYLNNARQVAKLPDWAIIDLTQPVTTQDPGGVPVAGFFGEHWELK